MSEENQAQEAAPAAATEGPAAAMSPAEMAQQFKVLRTRIALLTGLVVADTAMLIVLMILFR